MKKNVLVLPGDGIGQEVCEAALPVISAMGLPITLTFGEIGWTCWEREGNPVPARTWEQIAHADAVLLGAITSKGKVQAQQALPLSLQQQAIEYVSPVIQLRQKLGLYANIRPVKYVSGDRRPFRCCVIRENTEGLYAGMDFKGVGPGLLAGLNTRILKSMARKRRPGPCGCKPAMGWSACFRQPLTMRANTILPASLLRINRM